METKNYDLKILKEIRGLLIKEIRDKTSGKIGKNYKLSSAMETWPTFIIQILSIK